MKIRPLRMIAGFILGFTLLFGIGIGSSTTVQAQNRNGNDDQNRNWDRYGNYGGSAELRQTALNAGYNEGIREASNDRQRGSNRTYQNSSTYQKATQGYSWRLGNRELYRRYFREAFVNGYNSDDNNNFGRDDRDRNDNGNRNRRGRNWDGYKNYGGSFQLRQTALNAGYNEGIKQGRNDRNKGNGSDYHDNGAYQKATSDYSAKLGDRELFRRYYREAYENGYDAGIKGY